MAKNFQIVDAPVAGTTEVLHPETNADNVLDGKVNKVPTKTQVINWDSKSQEVVNARGDKVSLKAKIDDIDTRITSNSSRVKTMEDKWSAVDGSGGAATKQDITEINTSLESNAKQKENYSKKNTLETLLEKDCNVVITGDSLSYNRYSYFDDFGREAKNYNPGMLSWSFMLKDAINRHDVNFKSCEELNYIIKNGVVEQNPSTSVYKYAFNNIVSKINATNTTEVSFDYYTSIRSKNIVLYMCENSTTTGCTFDVYVNNVKLTTVDTRLNSGEYNGLKTFSVVLNGSNYNLSSNVTITFKNFVSESGNSHLYLYGVGTINRNIDITGKGGYTTTDLLVDVNERIISYSPDLLILIIGANDLIYNDINIVKNNMKTLLNTVRSNKPNCEILLLSTPLLDGYDIKIKEQLLLFYDLALEYSAYFINLIDLFKNDLTNDWRYDQIHLTRYGNEKLCREILKTILPNGLYDKKLVNPKSSFANGLKYYNNTFNVLGVKQSCIMTWNTTNAKFDLATLWGSNLSLLGTITKDSDFKFTINFVNKLTSMPHISQYGGIGDNIIVVPYSVTQTSVTFATFKYSSGALVTTVASDWVANKFNFVLTI